MQTKYAAPTKVNVSPPRLKNLERCGNHNIAAVGSSQSEFKKNKCTPTGVTMNKVAVMPIQNEVSTPGNFNPKQIEILKNSICKGVSNEEFEVFLMACTKTQLDPFMKQIYAVKRKSRRADGTWGETMTIQTGIDGFRLIADRTGKYSPGQEPTFEVDQNGKIVSATSYIKKLTHDGTWHTVSASAYFDEYAQMITDKQTGERKPSDFWSRMPRTMIAKCAEALAIRKAFPAELSGIYTTEEMSQADIDITPKISLEQASELEMILGDCDEKYRNWVFEYVKKQYKTENLAELPADIYKRMKDAAVKNMEANRVKQQAEPELLIAEVQ